MEKTIQDGTASFAVRDKRIKALVDLFFPVGTIISRDDDTEPEILKYGKWEKIAEGRVLQGAGGGHNVGENVDAGIPNIVGNIQLGVWGGNTSGALYIDSKEKMATAYTDTNGAGIVAFDASKSNPIYGASDTVQPAAHIVVFWKRIE